MLAIVSKEGGTRADVRGEEDVYLAIGAGALVGEVVRHGRRCGFVHLLECGCCRGFVEEETGGDGKKGEFNGRREEEEEGVIFDYYYSYVIACLFQHDCLVG